MPRPPGNLVLACDVGGTKTSLALLEREAPGAALRFRAAESFPSQEHASLDRLIETFRSRAAPGAPLAAAGLGLAGPVVEGRARITNLPWEVDGARLAAALGLPAVTLLNDAEAHAWSLPWLAPSQRGVLQAAPPGAGPAAVVAVGTGAGYAVLAGDGAGALSLASEGGHADFAPSDELQVELWRSLRDLHGHVSVERVLSGPGLLTIHDFLRRRRGEPVPAALAAATAAGEGAAAVAAAAQAGSDPVCAEAVDIFLTVLGAEAGNWALRTLSRGGLWLGGGVPAKLLFPAGAPSGWSERARAAFLAAFRDKGRFRPLLEGLPVGVILDPRAALLGAAHRALSLASPEDP